MSVVTTAQTDRAQMKEINARLAEARPEVAELRKEKETAVQSYQRTKKGFRVAEKAAEDLRDREAEVQALTNAKVELLERLGGTRSFNPDGPQPLGDVDENAAGSWLASVVRQPGYTRDAMALSSPLTTEGMGSIEATDRLFFRRLERHSALLGPAGIQVVEIETTKIDVGEVTGDMEPAAPVAETDPITKSDFPLEDRVIHPPKFPVLVTMSVEAHNDARPIRMAALESKMLQAIGLGFDAAGFHGAAGSLHPGLANTPGIAVVKAAEDDVAYDWAADAIGAVLNVSGLPVRLFISPFTVQSLLKLKSTTNEYQIANLQSAASDLMGVPVTITRGVNDGEAFMVDTSTLVIIRRQQVQTEVFPGYDVDHALVGVRAMMRAHSSRRPARDRAHHRAADAVSDRIHAWRQLLDEAIAAEVAQREAALGRPLTPRSWRTRKTAHA